MRGAGSSGHLALDCIPFASYHHEFLPPGGKRAPDNLISQWSMLHRIEKILYNFEAMIGIRWLGEGYRVVCEGSIGAWNGTEPLRSAENMRRGFLI